MAVTEHPLAGLGYTQPTVSREFVRLDESGATDAHATIAEEVPIALVYNNRPHVVVMGTPADFEDLARGFSITEGIVSDICDVQRVEAVRASHGVELQIEISSADAVKLEERSRSMVARTSCGLCGVETISDAMRTPAPVTNSLHVSRGALERAGAALSRQQTLNNQTSAVHAAGWATADGAVTVVREDVGRHNALDKLLGAVLASGTAPSAGFVVVTSRASYEMVQKTATCGVELLAAISRPTALAIRFAEAANMTLVGLLRGSTANVYTGAGRITT
jgi:FdhD protein